jgi:hypothetical protein
MFDDLSKWYDEFDANKAVAVAGVAAYAVGGTVLCAASLVAAAKATSVGVVVGAGVAMVAGAGAVVYAVNAGPSTPKGGCATPEVIPASE